MTKEELVRLAFEARKHSYAPYSHYECGAAIETEDGSVYQGCNVENASYGGTICGERTAALKAVYDGHRRFVAIAAVGFPEGADTTIPSGKRPAAPCGLCRQVLKEFAAPGMKVYTATCETEIYEYTFEEIFPHSFGPEDL